MKKRIVALACAMTMATALLAGCGNSSKETKAETQQKQLLKAPMKQPAKVPQQAAVTKNMLLS